MEVMFISSVGVVSTYVLLSKKRLTAQKYFLYKVFYNHILDS